MRANGFCGVVYAVGVLVLQGCAEEQGAVDGGDADPLTCGQGTTREGDTCIAVIADPICGPGTQLNPTKTGCVVSQAAPGSLLFAATSDRIWSNLKYNNAGSVSVLGDATTVTATQNLSDATPIYLAGVGTTNAAFDTVTAPMFQFGARPAVPVFWDANPGNPSSTPMALDHQITVGEWRKCTQQWAVYANPPSNTAQKHLYRVIVDLVDCPADVTFGLWFNYATGKYQNTSVLGTPAGGLPNIVVTQADGSAHFERDFDPNVWTKSGLMQNGSTHGAMGTGVIPDLTTNPEASFWIATFVHNDGQSNGNAGWCTSADGMTTACGVPNSIGSFLAGPPAIAGANQVGNLHAATPSSTAPLAAPYVRPYVYLPGKVGFDSVSAFTGGAVTNVSTNTMPLAQLQPY